MKCANPQEWNIGAAIIVVSRALSGIFENSAAAGSSESGCLRAAPFGRAGRARGEDHDSSLLRGRRERRVGFAALDQLLEPRVGLRSGRSRVRAKRRSVSACAALADQLGELLVVDQRDRVLASITSAICGPANAVFRYSALAPSLEHATVASTKPRWLRHMIATPSCSPMPSRRASARLLVRRATSSADAERSRGTVPGG